MWLSRKDQQTIDKMTDQQLLDGLIEIGKTEKSYTDRDRRKACSKLVADYADHPYLKIEHLTNELFVFTFIKDNVRLAYDVVFDLCQTNDELSDKLLARYESFISRLVNKTIDKQLTI